jgi:hypothetical protein
MGYLIRVPIVRVDIYHQTLHYGGRLTIFSFFLFFLKNIFLAVDEGLQYFFELTFTIFV